MTSPRGSAVPLIQLSAYEDIADIWDRVSRNAGGRAADRVTDRILSGIDLLETMPYLGPLHDDELLARLGYRKLVLDNYVAVYRVDENRATVLRVSYGSRDYTRIIETH